MMKCGFYERNITPPLGASMDGYFNLRPCQGVKDELYVKALCVTNGEHTAAVVSVDIIYLPDGDFCDKVYERVEKLSSSIKRESIILSATHSHTSGPHYHERGIDLELDNMYINMLALHVADAIILAEQRMEEAKLAYAVTNVEGVAFVRNYRMKDGSICTNPGYNNPDVVEPCCPPDTSLPSLFFYDMSGNIKGVLTNFALHHDTVGGRLASADYSGVLSQKLKETYGNDFVCVFLNGPCGNVNHIDWIGGPNKSGIPNHIRIGSALADGIVSSEKDALAVTDCTVSGDRKFVKVKRRVVDTDLLAEAKDFVDNDKKVNDFDSGKPDSLAFRIAVAPVIVKTYNNDCDEYECPITAIRIGDCAIYATPCEMFSHYADVIKRNSPTDKVFISELSSAQTVAYVPPVELLGYDSVYENHPITRSLEETAGDKMTSAAIELGDKLFGR